MINCHKYITTINSALFVAENRRLQKKIDEIHKWNQEAHRKRSDFFMYQGRAFVPDTNPVGGSHLTLHMDLWNIMDQHLADEAAIHLDRDRIGQLLFKLLEPCAFVGGSVHQNIRDAIPDCILDSMPEEIRSLQRCSAVGHTLNHGRDYRLLAELLPKIEFYSATRFIY